MAYADAVTREAAWFVDTTGTAATLPSITAAGVDVIGAYPRRLTQKRHQLWLWREDAAERRTSVGWKAQVHGMVATILWQQHQPAAKADADQQALDTAIEAVVARIRGVAHDHTHGNRFWSVADTSLEGLGDADVIAVRHVNPASSLVSADAPLGAGQAYEVEIRWRAIDRFQQT